MNNNIIKDIVHKDTGFKPTQIQEQFKTQWLSLLNENIQVGGKSGKIIINNAPNRIGKTITTLKYFDDENAKVLYLADRHNHINEVELTLKTPKFIHWAGIDRLCRYKYEDPDTAFLIDNKVPAGIVCDKCPWRKGCKYWTQWKIEDNSIVGTPKELIPTSYVQKEEWDVVIFDEIIDKEMRIKPHIPHLNADIFDYFGIKDLYYSNYIIVEGLKKQQDFKEAKGILQDDAQEIRKKILPNLAKQIKNSEIDLNHNSSGELLKYLAKYSATVEWVKYCAKYGHRTHFFNPYLYKILDLIKKHGSNIILINTSLDEQFYNLILNNYEKELPEPELFSFNIQNKNNLLLHYKFLKRAFSKNSLFIEDENEKLQANRETYGIEAYNEAVKIIKFCKKEDLSVGVITANKAMHLFEDIADEVSYFGGHQGSNQLDNIDVLLIYGTYNVNPQGLYQKYYMVTNELLINNQAKWNNYRYINDYRITFSNNEILNQIKYYKLKEEHGQAIFRNGAHVQDNKIVISFGFVPKEYNDTLTYRKFSNARGAKISISKWLKKSKTAKQEINT